MGTALAGVLIVISVGFAQGSDPWIGAWKLNLAKSTFSPGPPPKSNTLKIEAVVGGAQRHTFDRVNAKGQPTHSERIGKFDNVDIPVQAVQPPTKTVTNGAFRRLEARSFEVTSTSDGKATTTTRVVISADGKTRTQTQTGTNAQGQTVNSVNVYDRQ